MPGRLKPRYLVQKAVTINKEINALCFDINEEGMYIQTNARFRVKDDIVLSFALSGKRVDVRASVRHVDEGFGFGVKFTDIPSEASHALRELLGARSSEPRLKVALLVEGNAQLRGMYKHRLMQDGISVLEASNGTEAFKVLQLTKPAIVIVDSSIEGVSAFKLLQYIRTRAELNSVPVVVISSRFVPEEAEKMLSLGVKDYLVKSTTTPKQFSEKILGLINK